MADGLRWVSPLGTVVDSGGTSRPLWAIEARDLARGFCGALFVALPLLYTLEMWERARVIPEQELALIVAGAYLANVGFAVFGGFKPDLERRAAWFDAVSAMGIGLVAAAVTLFLIARYTLDVPPTITISLLLLEMVPCSFGASLAINQLGARPGNDRSRRLQDALPADVTKLLGTVLGGLLFTFNIAPTVEPKLIAYGLTSWHTLGIVTFSLAVSYIMVFFAGFVEDEGRDRGILRARWLETVVTYLISLGVAALLLWMFGYLSSDTPPGLVLPWLVTLGYGTSLAGSAGRLIL